MDIDFSARGSVELADHIMYHYQSITSYESKLSEASLFFDNRNRPNYIKQILKGLINLVFSMRLSANYLIITTNL